ncbi:hypothetical protein CIPAW_03G110400 [Carya illinoinensis]|uniref:CCHC-type domain-containing protein n=1 Tax=Carya illinoinensis TaxID=32201 RepID=A0A8T1R1U9_CARIL|nr:hypothetical protein CIPAW_03G110400 [Carya illinoinensis]
MQESSEDEENEDKDEEVAMITRRIQRFLKKNRTSPRKSFKKFSKKDSGKNDTLICYKCNKPGHIKPDCPLLKKDRNKGKKAMKATWDDDSSSSDSEASNEESANLCLMRYIIVYSFNEAYNFSFALLVDVSYCKLFLFFSAV